jgi:hypothetical protein
MLIQLSPTRDTPKPVEGSDELILRPSEGMSVKRMESFLEEIRTQPAWRRQADKEADYYDGNQLTAEQIDEYEGRGYAPLITNLIKPTIDVVLGMEAKTRSDWMVRPEEGEINADLAEVLNARLHKAEVGSRADRACSDAYADAVKVGLGWVEVSKPSDPFDFPQRVRRIHRREIFFDWRSGEPDLSDARYLVRKRWMDEDAAVGMFPDHAELIRNCLQGWAHWDSVTAVNNSYALELARALDVQRGFSVEQYEWLNTIRRRIAAYEVWYRTVTKGHVLRLPDGRVVEFDRNKDEHVAAVYSGTLQPIPAIFKKVRLSWWLGPHRISDEASPYGHNLFPYVPVWGYREDRTGTPYGLIRGMLSPQDEINARRSKMLWLLNSRRVIADGDAVVDHDEARDEVGRPDAYIELNPGRRPDSRFDVEDGGQLATQQFQVLEAAKNEIQQASGVFQSMLGDAKGGASSGLAINSLIEQGVTTLAEINDNYRFARRLIGEQLLELIVDDLAEQGPTTVWVGEDDQKREVAINQPGVDEMGQRTIINDVTKARVAIVIDDAPTSPTVRMQQTQALAEMVKAAPPQVQGLIYDMVIDAMDLPNKREIIKRLRGAMGMQGPDGQPIDPAAAQAQQQVAQIQQEAQAQIQQLSQQLMDAQAQLKNKDGELAVKNREVGIKEADLAIKAAAAQANPDQLNALVQQAIAPIVEHLSALLSGSGLGAAAQSAQQIQGGQNGYQNTNG